MTRQTRRWFVAGLLVTLLAAAGTPLKGRPTD